MAVRLKFTFNDEHVNLTDAFYKMEGDTLGSYNARKSERDGTMYTYSQLRALLLPILDIAKYVTGEGVAFKDFKGLQNEFNSHGKRGLKYTSHAADKSGNVTHHHRHININPVIIKNTQGKFAQFDKGGRLVDITGHHEYKLDTTKYKREDVFEIKDFNLLVEDLKSVYHQE